MIAVLLLLLDVPTLASPGPLARPHAALDRQCDKCHVPFKGIPAANCLACHEHTAREVAQQPGLPAATDADDGAAFAAMEIDQQIMSQVIAIIRCLAAARVASHLVIVVHSSYFRFGWRSHNL